MKFEDPSTWTRDEFEAYVLLVAAATDSEIVPEEKEIIKKKAGDSWNGILNAFRSGSDAEHFNLILANKDRFLKTKEDHDRIKAEVVRLFESDHDYSAIEHGVNSILQRIL